ESGKEAESHLGEALVEEVRVDVYAGFKAVGEGVHYAGVEQVERRALGVARVNEAHRREGPHVHGLLGVDVVTGQHGAAGNLAAGAAGGREGEHGHLERSLDIVLGAAGSEKHLYGVYA